MGLLPCLCKEMKGTLTQCERFHTRLELPSANNGPALKQGSGPQNCPESLARAERAALLRSATFRSTRSAQLRPELHEKLAQTVQAGPILPCAPVLVRLHTDQWVWISGHQKLVELLVGQELATQSLQHDCLLEESEAKICLFFTILDTITRSILLIFRLHLQCVIPFS